jgi:protein SCO1
MPIRSMNRLQYGNPLSKLAQWAAVLVLLAAGHGWAAQRYSATGLVLKVDPSHLNFVVSCASIPGYMDAMVMPISVRASKVLQALAPGAMVDFTLVVTDNSSYAENIRVRKFESLAPDPWQARQLGLLQTLISHSPPVAPLLTIGQQVPDFKLIDQEHRPVSLAQFAGKVVAMNFVYTRCVLPDFCYRLSNNFGRLQKRFATQMGRNLVLLTVTFDPVHDQPQILADYARTWKADPKAWRFLTGPPAEVQKVCSAFGVNAWQDEGLLTHTLHTIIIDRRGRLAINLEGNQFTAEQLGDLVQTILQRSDQILPR